MESRRKGAGVGHSVETGGFDGVGGGDKGKARVTVVCLRGAGSSETEEHAVLRPVNCDGVATGGGLVGGWKGERDWLGRA